MLDLNEFNDIVNFCHEILDLIFSNCQINNIHSCPSLTPQIDSYHPPFEFFCKPGISEIILESLSPTIFNFNAYNFNEIYYFLSHMDFICI